MSARWRGAVDPDAARKAAETILADRRFHPDRAPRPFAGFFRRVGELLADPVIRFFDAVGDAVAEVGTGAWLGIALVVIVAATVLTVRLSAGRSRQRFPGGRGGGDGDDDDDLDPEELERRAEEAERAGDLDGALRLRFRAGLGRLAGAGAVQVRPGLTNAAVSRTLRSPRFDELAVDFDEVAYGGRPATDADLATARSAWRSVVEAAEASPDRAGQR